MVSLLLPAFSNAFLRGSQTTNRATRRTSRSYSQAEWVPSSKVTCKLPRSPCRKSTIAVTWVASTHCITSFPSLSSTATEMVLWWTSRPIYLMLSIGCSFRQVWFTASHSNHNLLRKGRPFIMRAPGLAGFETRDSSRSTITLCPSSQQERICCFYSGAMPWGLERWHGGQDQQYITFGC